MVALRMRLSALREELNIERRQAADSQEPKRRPAPVMTASPTPVYTEELPEPTTLSTSVRSASSLTASGPATTTKSAALESPTILLTAPSSSGIPYDSPHPPVATLTVPTPEIIKAPSKVDTPANDHVANAIGIVFAALAIALTIGFVLVICTVRRRRTAQRLHQKAKPQKEQQAPPPPYPGQPFKHLSELGITPRTPMCELPHNPRSPAKIGGHENTVAAPVVAGNNNILATTTTTVAYNTAYLSPDSANRPASPWPFPNEKEQPIPDMATPMAKEFVLQPPPKTLFSRLSRYSGRYSRRETGLTLLNETQFRTYLRLNGGVRSSTGVSPKANAVLGVTDSALPSPALEKAKAIPILPVRKPYKMLGRFPTRDEWKKGKVSSSYCPN